jgi:hypothetical protein
MPSCPSPWQRGCGLDTSGNYLVSVIGDSFGTSSSSYVMFGSGTVVIPTSITHTLVTFRVPEGVGRNISVRLVVGSRQSNRISFAYDPPYVSNVSPDQPNGIGDVIR